MDKRGSLRQADRLDAYVHALAGIGAGRLGEASVVVGNFLFDFDYIAMVRAWRVPSETYRQLAREGLEKYVTTLKHEMANGPTMEKVKTLLVEKYRAVLQRPLETGTLTEEEKERACAYEEKLGTEEWLFEIAFTGIRTLQTNWPRERVR